MIGLTVVLAVVASCGDDSNAGVEVSGVWARPTPAGSTTGAVYLTMRSAADDALVGVSIEPDVAAEAMVHETTSEDGQMTMKHSSRVELRDGEDVVLKPGGYHVMLTDLAAPLRDGDTIELTLELERSGDITITVVVGDEAP